MKVLFLLLVAICSSNGLAATSSAPIESKTGPLLVSSAGRCTKPRVTIVDTDAGSVSPVVTMICHYVRDHYLRVEVPFIFPAVDLWKDESVIYVKTKTALVPIAVKNTNIFQGRDWSLLSTAEMEADSVCERDGGPSPRSTFTSCVVEAAFKIKVD